MNQLIRYRVLQMLQVLRLQVLQVLRLQVLRLQVLRLQVLRMLQRNLVLLRRMRVHRKGRRSLC